MLTEKRKTLLELDISNKEKKLTDTQDSEFFPIGIHQMLKSKLPPEFQWLLIVVMTIVLLVTDIKSVKFAEEENYHKVENVSKDVQADGTNPENLVIDVKDGVPDVETEKIAKNVLEEKYYTKEIVSLHAQVNTNHIQEFVEKWLSEQDIWMQTCNIKSWEEFLVDLQDGEDVSTEIHITIIISMLIVMEKPTPFLFSITLMVGYSEVTPIQLSLLVTEVIEEEMEELSFTHKQWISSLHKYIIDNILFMILTLMVQHTEVVTIFIPELTVMLILVLIPILDILTELDLTQETRGQS